MLPRNRAYGLATAARDVRHGRGCAAGRMAQERRPGTNDRGEQADRPSGERANERTGQWAGRRPQWQGSCHSSRAAAHGSGRSVGRVRGGESGDYILYKKKRKVKENKGSGRVINKRLSEERRREGENRSSLNITARQRQNSVTAIEGTTPAMAHTDRQADKQANKQTEKQANRQTAKQEGNTGAHRDTGAHKPSTGQQL